MPLGELGTFCNFVFKFQAQESTGSVKAVALFKRAPIKRTVSSPILHIPTSTKSLSEQRPSIIASTLGYGSRGPVATSQTRNSAAERSSTCASWDGSPPVRATFWQKRHLPPGHATGPGHLRRPNCPRGHATRRPLFDSSRCKSASF